MSSVDIMKSIIYIEGPFEDERAIQEDPSEMRKALIHKLAEDQMEASKKRNESYVHDSVSSRDIINK